MLRFLTYLLRFQTAANFLKSSTKRFEICTIVGPSCVSRKNTSSRKRTSNRSHERTDWVYLAD